MSDLRPIEKTPLFGGGEDVTAQIQKLDDGTEVYYIPEQVNPRTVLNQFYQRHIGKIIDRKQARAGLNSLLIPLKISKRLNGYEDPGASTDNHKAELGVNLEDLRSATQIRCMNPNESGNPFSWYIARDIVTPEGKKDIALQQIFRPSLERTRPNKLK